MGQNQRGFIALPLTAWIAVGAAVVFVGMSVALKIQTSRLDACKQESEAFKAKVKAEGEAAIVEAKRITDENNARKAEYDKKLKNLRAANAILDGRLRDSAGQSSLPASTGTAGQSDATACFNRGILDGAIRAFTAGTAAIAVEGQSAVDELNNAREWARR